jgi:hypothetical protein
VYRRCLYCSADLGANEAVGAFPVGRTLAFDAGKGRLWAVCPRCARWNLAPLEERWEAVEEAERRFRGARLRVQSENVGLARLPDGTRLVRVGAALPGELAAWRYGGQLVRRRRRYLLLAGIAIVGIGVAGGVPVLGVSLGGATGMVIPFWMRRREQKVVYRLPAHASPTGEALELRVWHARRAVLGSAADGGGIELRVPDWRRSDPPGLLDYGRPPGEEVVLGDARARAFLGRALVHLNDAGASRRRLAGAVELLADSRSAEGYLRQLTAAGVTLGERRDLPGRHLRADYQLALEMALHEAQERRALEGELALLEAAWREAEEIAGIADRLALAPSSAAPEG